MVADHLGDERLSAVRERIDDIDRNIIVLLAERVRLAESMAGKKQGPEALYAAGRRKSVLDSRVHWAAAQGLDADFIHRQFEGIVDHCLARQVDAQQRLRAPEGQPLVYSCSGCSSAAQLANALALRLDRRGLAEMSCIAGIGGNVKSLVHKALSGRPILAIDGCPLNCTKESLARYGIKPDKHWVLSDSGVKKRYHSDYSEADCERLEALLASELNQSISKEYSD